MTFWKNQVVTPPSALSVSSPSFAHSVMMIVTKVTEVTLTMTTMTMTITTLKRVTALNKVDSVEQR